MTMARLYPGDCLATLRTLPDGAARCCVTSPPYWGLRDYGHDGQLGLEPTPDAYVAAMVAVFREVRRVLADDGTLWLNLGDSYASGSGGTPRPGSDRADGIVGLVGHRNRNGTPVPDGLKHKDLVGIPWRVAFALQADGWYLRSDIIWAKPNPMPESVTDRPTKAHEYLFLLSKQARYYYNANAIAEAIEPSQRGRIRDDAVGGASHTERGQHSPGGRYKQDGHGRRHEGFNARYAARVEALATRNARTVWTIPTQPYAGVHFATFPEELARRCIVAGSAPGDTVLDPFAGSGTVGQVATGNGRSAILCELNPAYIELARQRIGPMLCATP